MPVHLLDVNVLIALAWPNHEHHAAVHRWFGAVVNEGFATCPITQCGFVRISSNPRIIREAVSPREAVGALRRFVFHPQHVFWADDIGFSDAALVPHELLTGHRQVTDAYLLALAVRCGGWLATVDQGIASLVRSDRERNAVTFIPLR